MTDMTIEQIEAELAELDREIVGLDEALKSQHEESGSNSIDDDGQEAVADRQRLDLVAAQIEEKRHRVIELHALLAQKRAT